MRPFVVEITAIAAGQHRDTSIDFYLTVQDLPIEKAGSDQLIVSLRTLDTSIALLSVSVENTTNSDEAYVSKYFQLDFGGYWSYEDYVRALAEFLDLNYVPAKWPCSVEDFGLKHANHMPTVRGWPITEEQWGELDDAIEAPIKRFKGSPEIFKLSIGAEWNDSKSLLWTHRGSTKALPNLPMNMDLFNMALKRLPAI